MQIDEATINICSLTISPLGNKYQLMWIGISNGKKFPLKVPTILKRKEACVRKGNAQRSQIIAGCGGEFGR
jgi:hypothetical protein